LKLFRTAKKILIGMKSMHVLQKKKVFLQRSLSKTRKGLYISCLDL